MKRNNQGRWSRTEGQAKRDVSIVLVLEDSIATRIVSVNIDPHYRTKQEMKMMKLCFVG